MFKYEVHLHSCALSACGVSSSEEMVNAAKESGYSGVVFTNHFFHGNTCIDRHLPWREFAGAYRDDYLLTKKYAKKKDIDVLFGIEEVYEPGKEALIYGIEPEDIVNEPSFLKMSIGEMSDFVHEKGGFIACAHPFRKRDYIPDSNKEPDMKYFDAIEVHNFFNTPEDNKKAELFALRDHLQVISGGDIHRAEDFGNSGLAFGSRIPDNSTLVAALKSGDYKLIIGGSVTENINGNYYK